MTPFFSRLSHRYHVFTLTSALLSALLLPGCGDDTKPAASPSERDAATEADGATPLTDAASADAGSGDDAAVAEDAAVGADASVDEDASVGEDASVDADASVGEDASVDEDASVGEDAGADASVVCAEGLTLCGESCVDTSSDLANCGGCSTQCDACNLGVCTQNYRRSGVQKDVPVTDLVGWTQCHASSYGTEGALLSDVLASCSGANLMLACRTAGSETLRLAAWAPREAVLSANTTYQTHHVPAQANGVGWYRFAEKSWGFAGGGDEVYLNSCDYNSGSPQANSDLRLCWHTSEGKFTTGFRCGSSTHLGAGTERVIYHMD